MKQSEIGRKSSQAVAKSKRVTTDEKQMNGLKSVDKYAKDCTESVN